MAFVSCQPVSALLTRMLLADLCSTALCWFYRLFVDPALDNLLHLHDRSKHTAKNGANGDPEKGSQGPHRSVLN